MKEEKILKAYEIAKEQYAEYGIDTDAVINQMDKMEVSLHCWQGDDVAGFEKKDGGLTGGIMTTGNYPGRARNPQELRADLDKAMSLMPGTQKVNVHAFYLEADQKVDRNEVEIKHFQNWVDWAKQRGIGLDFNPTLFSHDMFKDGYSVASFDKGVRDFWIEHATRCREIANYMGEQTGKTCVNNFWIPDGSKDLTATKAARRELLKDSLDKIYAKDYADKNTLDAVESKLFGIGAESFTVGSNEFYLGYAVQNKKLICLDAGHFHPTEVISDKISACKLFTPGLLVHVSRGVRWDSDHVTILNDDMQDLMKEIKRANAFDITHLALDFFDASINRIYAWVIGTRAAQKGIMLALLENTEMLVAAEKEGNWGKRLALMEEWKQLPFGAVWDMYLQKSGVPTGQDWFNEVEQYEKDVLSKR